MAQIPTNAKIEELRFKIKTDPKSRHFFPLAEELRKVGQLDEAEKILREGVEKHPAYLSGWISLGRLLKDTGKLREAVEVFQKGMTIDPGNLVAARLSAECYLALGEKVEAIKKFKLVNALMPGDEDIESHIEALEQELSSGADVAVSPAPGATAEEPAPLGDDVEESTTFDQSADSPAADLREEVFGDAPSATTASLEPEAGNDPPPSRLAPQEDGPFAGDPLQTTSSDAAEPRAPLDEMGEESRGEDGFAMSRDAGVSPPDEDIFEDAAASFEEPFLSAPATGGGLAFEEAGGGMSILSTHAPEPEEDPSDIFAASLEIPAPATEEPAGDASEGPWLDDQPETVPFAGDTAAPGSPSSWPVESVEPLGAPEESAAKEALIKRLAKWEARVARKEGG